MPPREHRVCPGVRILISAAARSAVRSATSPRAAYPTGSELVRANDASLLTDASGAQATGVPQTWVALDAPRAATTLLIRFLRACWH
jgi:hypothetical protein